MTTLRVPLPSVEPGLVELPEGAAAYVARVHRLGKGDRFVAFDPDRAVEADAEIVEIGRRAVVARVGPVRAATTRPPREITLIQGICKGDKMDAIVRDATELGATRIVPLLADRSVARPEAARAERWRRIAVEAARQSGRGDAPAVTAPMTLADALATRGDARGFCLDPAADRPLGDALAEIPAGAPIAVLVGPEGGFTEAECIAAERAGYTRATIGPLVLRAETVCAAVLGAALILASARRA